MILILPFLFVYSAHSAQCNFDLNRAYKENAEVAHFLKNSLFATHLQLTHENFNSINALQSRTKIFDIIIDTPYWRKKFSTQNEFKLFWNWVRFQFWGLLQQQALLKEDQGFKISFDKSLYERFDSIHKFPIYPHPLSIQTYSCQANDENYYPCSQNIVKATVLLSPALACDKALNSNNLTFSYYLILTTTGWTIIDIEFKGRNLIADSYTEHDNMLNKYGSEKALNHLKLLLNKVPLLDPQTRSVFSGSTVFDRDIKIKAPTYPIDY